MSDKFSSEFKAKIALEAVSQGKSVIKEIAEKYDVSEDQVIAWAAQLQDEASQIFTTEPAASDEDLTEDVEISTDDEEFAVAVGHGVMSDTLNYSKLIFWSTLGTALVVIFVVGLIYFSQYSLFETQKEVSAQSTFSEVKELKAEQDQELNSFGVVDLEEGIYRIPIDSAISRIAVD
ncbi:transposase [Gracilimonas tropica]|uniref:transposase n=1 Tax=Gracilimonas tropica TaxID=454600 RepID=UPI0003750688|nr:transposase [Gracilimonas tropica]